MRWLWAHGANPDWGDASLVSSDGFGRVKGTLGGVEIDCVADIAQVRSK